MSVQSDFISDPYSQIQKLLDLALDVICSIDAADRFLTVSAAAKQVWGYEPGELVGVSYLTLVVPEDREKTAAKAEEIKAGVTLTHFENRYLRKDGSVVPMVWSARLDKSTGIMYCVAKDATEKEEAEKKAKHFEQRLYRSYRLGKFGWWEWDAKEGKNIASDELYAIYGLNKEEHPVLTTELYLSLVHPEDIPKVLSVINQNKLKAQHQYEHRMIKPNGQLIYVLHYVESLIDENGVLQQINGVTKDITEIRLAEVTLRESQQKQVTILESIGDCFFAMDRNWVVTYWNHQAEELLGKKREDIIGKKIWDVYSDETTQGFYQRYEEAFRDNKPLHFEEYYQPVDMWIEISAYPSAEGMSIYFKDVTERKKAQEDLRKSNQRYELASMATSDAIWDLDLQANRIFWGEGFRKMFGHTMEMQTSSTDTWIQLLHPDDRKKTVDGLEAVIHSPHNNWLAEYRFLKADGSYAFVLDKGFVIRDNEGHAVRMVGAMQDITQKKNAGEALRLSEERYRLLFDQSPVPKWMVNGQTLQVVEVNEAALLLYGYSKEEFLQLNLHDLILDEDHPELETFSGQQPGKYKDIIRHRKKNGEILSLEITTHPIELPAGLHFIVTGADVTERIALQQQVLEEKFAAQKEMAKVIIDTQENERSEIAKELHDNVNQLLTTAKLYIENIGYFPQQREIFVQKSVELLQRTINEIRSLSKQLVTPVINDIGFKATLEELLNHYSAMNLFQIGLAYQLDEEQLEKGLQLTIYRIIQEQLSNIVKHAKASIVHIDATKAADAINISIEDNGVGFDKRKFTKGLGLKNMKNRAEVYKGDLCIVSEPGKGTIVSVRFPLPKAEK